MGSKYGLFGNGFVPYNIIVGPGYQLYQSESGYNDAATRAAIDRAMANADLYPVSQIEDQLLKSNVETLIDLAPLFYNNTGSEITYAVSSNTDPAVCSISFNGDVMSVTGGSSIGQTGIEITASAGTVVATLAFSVEVYDPTLVQTVNEDFETAWMPDGWTQKNTGSGFLRSSAEAVSGSYSATHGYYAANQNDLLITPKFLVEDGAKLVFWQKVTYSSYYDYHGISYSKDGNRYTPLAEVPASDSWQKVYIDLSSQAGNEIYLAFNYQGFDADIWYIDDVQVLSPSTGIEESFTADGVELFQNYPNPFNPSTSISFSVDKTSEVKLTVLNSKGEFVSELYSGKLNSGIHSYDFNAEDLNSGIYFYSLEYNGKKLVNKMLLIK
ncbi:MAG: choice-of-anchor J domain-containing protein [Candidatus Delongbacteria bacterium]|nr:choice-of-anchor J domain-containing protein [Candidatus Delongbacteria bacterium]